MSVISRRNQVTVPVEVNLAGQGVARGAAVELAEDAPARALVGAAVEQVNGLGRAGHFRERPREPVQVAGVAARMSWLAVTWRSSSLPATRRRSSWWSAIRAGHSGAVDPASTRLWSALRRALRRQPEGVRSSRPEARVRSPSSGVRRRPRTAPSPAATGAARPAGEPSITAVVQRAAAGRRRAMAPPFGVFSSAIAVPSGPSDGCGPANSETPRPGARSGSAGPSRKGLRAVEVLVPRASLGSLPSPATASRQATRTPGRGEAAKATSPTLAPAGDTALPRVQRPP